MAFLARWEDDTSEPEKKSALRDVAVRAFLPAVLSFLFVSAAGWALVDGPLKAIGKDEQGLNKEIAADRTPLWDDITLVFSWAGATVSIVGLCLVVVAFVWWRTKEWWFAVVPLIAITLQSLVFFFSSHLVGRDRPPVKMLDDSPPTTSFPSGHTSAATALYLTLAMMATRIRQPVLRWITIVLCVAMPFLVAWARFYRGMHHVSDLVFAVLNGTIAMLLAWGWLRRREGGETAAADDAVEAPRQA